MKVLHLIMSFNTGGAEKLLIDILNSDINVKQYLCVINKSYEYNLLKKIEKKNIILINRPVNSKNPYYLFKLLIRVIQFKPKIIHCHNSTSLFLGIILKRIFKNLKLIYTLHDTNILKNNNNLVIRINKYCDRLICISKSVELECIEEGINKNIISLIYNGINVEKYCLSKIKHKEVNIACIARLIPSKKGQDILIKSLVNVLKFNKDVHVYFAGDVPSIRGVRQEENKKILEEIIIKEKLEKYITFCGNVEDIPKFLQDKDIVILPSRNEGFGLVLIEAMAAKIPVIATNLEGPKEIIKDDYGYLFGLEDHEELSEKIIECIDNNKIDIEQTYDYVKNTYSIQQMCKKYYFEYVDIMEEKK